MHSANLAQITRDSHPQIQWKKRSAWLQACARIRSHREGLLRKKSTNKPLSLTMTLVLQQIAEDNLPSCVKIALTSNLPGPNATLSTTTMIALMLFVVLVTRNVMRYVKNISLAMRKMPILVNKGTTGPAARSRPGKTIETR